MPIYKSTFYPFWPFSHGAVLVTGKILEDSGGIFKIGVTAHFAQGRHVGILNGIKKEDWDLHNSNILYIWAEAKYYRLKHGLQKHIF